MVPQSDGMSRPVRTLLFAASFPPPAAGGSIEYLYNIFGNLPPHCAAIHTANSDAIRAAEFDRSFPQRVIRSDYIIHVLDGYHATALRKVKQYIFWPIAAAWLVLRHRPKIIQVGEYNITGIVALICKRLVGTPYIVYTYAEELTYLDTRPVHRRLLLAMLRNASAVITVCDYTRDLLVDRGVAPERIRKILPAVGASKRVSVSDDQIERVRAKFGLEGHHVLLTVGRIVERKGHASVIEAMPAVLREHRNVKYVIAGTGPREALLREHVLAAGLSDHVAFAGSVDDDELAAIYEACDCFARPCSSRPAHTASRRSAETPEAWPTRSCTSRPGSSSMGRMPTYLPGRSILSCPEPTWLETWEMQEGDTSSS
jgi:phosphatidyl-myo-inositol dimannoside synthase